MAKKQKPGETSEEYAKRQRGYAREAARQARELEKIQPGAGEAHREGSKRYLEQAKRKK